MKMHMSLPCSFGMMRGVANLFTTSLSNLDYEDGDDDSGEAKESAGAEDGGSAPWLRCVLQ